MFTDRIGCSPSASARNGFTDVDSIDGDGDCDDELSEPCTTCGFLLNTEEVLRCPCGHAVYCGTSCQAKDWPEHQTRCSAALEQQSVEICSNCRTTSTTLYVCRCTKTYYCSRYCQKRHWVRHAHVCASRVHECNAAHLHRPTANKGTQFGLDGEEGDPNDGSVSTASLSSCSTGGLRTPSGKDQGRVKKLASMIATPVAYLGSLMGGGAGSSAKLAPSATAVSPNPLAAITAKAQQRANSSSSSSATGTTATMTAAAQTQQGGDAQTKAAADPRGGANPNTAVGGNQLPQPLAFGDDAESDFLIDLGRDAAGAIHNASRIPGRERQHHHHRTVASSSVPEAATAAGQAAVSPAHKNGKRLSTTVKFSMQNPRASDAGVVIPKTNRNAIGSDAAIGGGSSGGNPLSLFGSSSFQQASFAGGVPRMDSIVASSFQVANTIAVAVYLDDDDPISRAYVGQDLSTIEIEPRKLTRKSVLLVERRVTSGKC